MPFPVIRAAPSRGVSATTGFVNAFGRRNDVDPGPCSVRTIYRLDGAPAEVERNLKRLVSIGRPLPDVQVKIVDDAGDELPTGEVGELWVFTPRTMKGYAGQDGGVTNPALEGWLPTRDMGWIDEDGYIFLAGRKDDMMIRGGENISPAEVEAVLYSHSSVEEAAVIGLPDVEWGQRVVAVVVRRPGAALDEAGLIEFCRERLASFKKPERVHFVDALPRTRMGKVLKKDLRAQLAES
jgi:acyl-CoA synthetase (AMP-forming)/AMP-acid ligase II